MTLLCICAVLEYVKRSHDGLKWCVNGLKWCVNGKNSGSVNSERDPSDSVLYRHAVSMCYTPLCAIANCWVSTLTTKAACIVSGPHTLNISWALEMKLNTSIYITAGSSKLLVYVIGWSTVVCGFISASNAVRKCGIVWGESECYFTLPDCFVNAIIPKYHSIDHPNPTSNHVTHIYCSCWTFYAAFTQEPNDRRAEKPWSLPLLQPCYCSTVDRCGCGCWVQVWYVIEVRDESAMSPCLAPCVEPSSSLSALLLLKKLTTEGSDNSVAIAASAMLPFLCSTEGN